MAAKSKQPARAAAMATAARRAATGKTPGAAAQRDLAETRSRLKRAKTPIAKAVLGKLLEGKEQAYSGRAARQHKAQAARQLSASKRR